MASRSGPAQAVYDSMTLIQQRNDPAKNDESNASLTAKSCPLDTHFAMHHWRFTDKTLPWSSLTALVGKMLKRLWSRHEVTEMDNHVGVFMAFNTILVYTFYTCNTLQHQWLLFMATAFCCCSHLALPSPQLAPNPPLPPLRIQPGQRLLNNIPQLVKPRKSQGWQASSMESRYLSDSLNIFPCLDVLQLC